MSRLDYPYVISHSGVLHCVETAEWAWRRVTVKVAAACPFAGRYWIYVPKENLRKRKPRGVTLCKTCFGLGKKPGRKAK